MLKKFFISMLGSMAALWLSLGILFFGTIIAIGIIAGKATASSIISGDKILQISLKGSINEYDGDGSLIDILSAVNEENGDNLATVIKALQLAKDDDSVKGVFIDCMGSELGMASRTEMLEAIMDFKESGKWVYAYADNYEQGDYYIATAADKIFLNPTGELNVHGLASQTLFFQNFLQKIGVEVQVVRVGSFKSAVEPFLRMDMSPENRLQTETYLNDIWTGVADTIATNRDMTMKEINLMADSLSMTWNPERYVESKAVTALNYRYEIENQMRSLLKIDKDKDMPYISPSEYVESKGAGLLNAGKDHIAVLYAVGDIVDTGDEGIVGETMAPEILRLANDDKVKGLVLRVNSGGGSAFASEQIWKALEEFKATGKPFYVSMGDYAASGGYYISCGADMIFSDASTLTGSIGIFGMLPNAKNLIENKLGVGVEYVETNPGANLLVPFEPLNPTQLNAMQQYVNRGYDLFTSRVAEGREIPVDSVKAIGGGRVWSGAQALKIGLVDEIGSLTATIKAINSKLNKEYPVVVYPETTDDLLVQILRGFNTKVEFNVPGLTHSEAKAIFDRYIHANISQPLQARMPMIVIR